MKVSKVNQQPFFQGNLSIGLYEKTGQKVVKTIESLATTALDDTKVIDLCSSVRNGDGFGEVVEDAARKFTELFEGITGKNLPGDKGPKILYNDSGLIMFGDVNPGETGGVLYKLDLTA